MLKGVARRLARLCGGILAGSLVSSGAFAATHQVFIRDTGFVPQTLNIVTGDTVQWVHDGTTFHSTTSATGLWDSDLLVRGEAFDYTFMDEGTYDYFSESNPSAMTGRIVVERGFAIGIISPIPNARFNPGENVNVQVSLSDPESQVTNIVLSAVSAGTNIVITNLPSELTFVLPNLAEGLYTLTATGRSPLTNRTSSAITIAVGDVEPAPADPPVITNIALISATQIRITGTTTSAAVHDILASPALGDGADWQVIGRATVSGASFEFTDTLAATSARRFYRVRVAGVPGGGGNNNPSQITSFERLPNGHFRVVATVNSTGTHALQGTASLSNPDWVTIASGTPTGGSITFTDEQAATLPRRFYRVLAQ